MFGDDEESVGATGVAVGSRSPVSSVLIVRSRVVEAPTPTTTKSPKIVLRQQIDRRLKPVGDGALDVPVALILNRFSAGDQ